MRSTKLSCVLFGGWNETILCRYSRFPCYSVIRMIGTIVIRYAMIISGRRSIVRIRPDLARLDTVQIY